MGPSALVADDITAGRLVAPFPAISLPARSYHAYVPDTQAADPAIAVFCTWLQAEGLAGLPPPPASSHAMDHHDH
jgi:LysR family glycine cleavage system transcriptional activator